MDNKTYTPEELKELEAKQTKFCEEAIPRLKIQAEYAELRAKISVCQLQAQKADDELAYIRMIAKNKEESDKS
jgi:hypothetical protein